MKITLCAAAAIGLLLAACGEDREPEPLGPGLFQNVQVNQDSSGRPQNETTIAVSPRDRRNVVGGWNDYRAGETHVGYGVSFDGGATWADGLVPEPDWPVQGDPAVAASADGAFYMAMISFERTSNRGGIYVSRSQDGGRTFQRAVRVQADPEVFEDKEYIAVDTSGSPHRGNVYVSWTNFDDRRLLTEIVLSRSTDGGQSWSAAQPISGPRSYFNGFVQGSVPAVAADGALYVAWYEAVGGFAPQLIRGLAMRAGAIAEPFAGRGILPPLLGVLPQPVKTRAMGGARSVSIRLARSADGGRTFGPPVDAAPVRDTEPLRFRTNSFPSIAVPPRGRWLGSSGQVHVAFASATGQDGGDIFVASSFDSGTTFRAPVRVNDDAPGAMQIFPWLAQDETGRLHAVWYDRRGDPHGRLLDLYYSASGDGGLTWSPNRRVTPAGFDPDTDFGGGFIGDYNGVAAAGGIAYALWTDTRSGGQDIFFAPLR
jgi:hypothetical protein